MADQNFYPADGFGDDEPSVDELLASARRDAAAQNPAQTSVPAYGGNDAGAADDAFTPDFGDSFADYGEYRPEQEAAPQEQPPEPEDYDEEDYDAYDDESDDNSDAPAPKKPKRRRVNRVMPLFVKVILYVVIVGLIAVGLGYGAWECAQDVMAFGRSDDSHSITIAENASVDEIAQQLHDEGFIQYPWLFKLYCKLTKSGSEIEPGTYELSYNYDYHALIKGMVADSPNRATVRVTIPEGYSCRQIFELMEKSNVCTAEALKQCAAETDFDYWFLEHVPEGQEYPLEGFLFPDTYDFYEDDDPERVLDKLLTNFDRKFTDKARSQLDLLNEYLAEKYRDMDFDDDYIASHQFTIYELITVASMIEKESGGAAESGLIASVIYNRLCDPNSFPNLEIDATIVYALGGVDHALTNADLQVDSPYNTYTHAGLPVGPISNPGLSSISAALNPSDSNYYFYALDEDTGMHHFSETYEEHQAFLSGAATQESTDGGDNPDEEG